MGRRRQHEKVVSEPLAPFVSKRVQAPRDIRARLAADYRAFDESDRRHYEAREVSIRKYSFAWMVYNIDCGEPVMIPSHMIAKHAELPVHDRPDAHGTCFYRVDPDGSVWTAEPEHMYGSCWLFTGLPPGWNESRSRPERGARR